MEDQPSSDSNDHDDNPAAVAVAKAAATKAKRMKGLLKRKEKSVYSRHQNGATQKKTSFDFDAARAQMGNIIANAQELDAFIAPPIPSHPFPFPTKKELEKKRIIFEMEYKQLNTTRRSSGHYKTIIWDSKAKPDGREWAVVIHLTHKSRFVSESTKRARRY